MKKTILASLLLFVCFYSIAQTKLLTIEDALVNNRGALAVKNLRQAQFIYGTDDLVYLDNQEGNDVWVRKGGVSYLTLDELNQKLKAAGLEEVKAMPAIQFNQSGDWIMTVGGAKVALNPASGKAKQLVDKNSSGKTNVEGTKAGYVAYVDNFNLYVTDGKIVKQ